MTLRLYIHQPAIVWAGRVNGTVADADYPVADLTFDTVTTGSNPPLEALDGLTVLIGTTPGGDQHGRTFIRKKSIFDDTLFIGRSSQGTHDGEVTIEDGDYISVINERRVWGRMPYHAPDGEIYKNADIPFQVDYTTDFFPVANTGPGFAGTIDPDTGVITVAFDGTGSFGLPVASDITDHDWDVGDGTITVGTSSSDTITATFEPGFRYVSLTVTNAAGWTHTAYCPVYARDPANDTSLDAFNEVNLRISPNGQQMSVNVLSDAPRSTYPDGTLVMLWEGEASSPSDRDHVKFIGWHHHDNAGFEFVRTGTLRDTTLECLDVAGKMDTIPGFAQSIESAETPAYWYEMKEPTIDLYTHYLLYWHSTVLEVADVFLTGAGSEWAFMRLESDGDTLYKQVNSHAQRLTPDHIFTCNRRGQLAFLPDPMLVDPFNRSSTVQANLEGYIAQMSVLHQRPPRVHWLWSSAVLTGWDYGPVDTDYTITVSADTLLEETTLPVLALPVAIPSGTTLNFGLGEDATLTANAALGATELAVAPLSTSIELDDTATYTVTTPANIPTAACMAPGRGPGHGATFQTTGNKLAKSDSDLASCEGNRYARINAEYSTFNIELAGGDDLGIDPGTLEWVESGDLVASALPQRALDFFPARGLVQEMNIRYSNTPTGLVKAVGLAWERETSGPFGVIVDISELGS